MKRSKIPVEKRAINFVERYLKREFGQFKNVERNPDYPGCDFIAKKGNKWFKIEVKGCGHPWGIPDLYYAEVKKSPKRLVADFLYVVYFIDQERGKLCRIPRNKIKSEFFTLKRSYRISGKFKNERVLGPFMEQAP